MEIEFQALKDFILGDKKIKKGQTFMGDPAGTAALVQKGTVRVGKEEKPPAKKAKKKTAKKK
tara:strand:- start:562 stop:747 length:186 start_codon:yes stop_codon:yes gene_type:complete